MADKSFADLLREAGVQPSGAIQYAQSLNRPVPYRSYTQPRPLPRRMRPADVRAYDDNPGVSQQAMSEMHRDRMNGQDAMLREAQGPASNQFADAGMVALETTGVPALRRSYDAFEAGRPREGIYEGIWGGLGLAGTLGAIPGARRAPRAPMREPVLPQMREAPTPLPSNVLPVRPPQPFRQSLIGGADDLTGASRGVFSEGPADGMPTRAPDAGSGDAGQTAGQRPQRFTQTSDDPYSREYEVQIDDGAMARVRIQRSDAGDDVQWDIEALQDGGVPATGARRNMLGLSAMRGVREVLAHDAQAYRPQRYTFEAASDMSGDTSARTGLYRSMIERDAASFGYVPSQDGQFFGLERRAPDAPTAGPSRPPPDTAKSYRPGPAKAGLFFSRRR